MSNSVKKAQVAWIEKVQKRLRITSTVLDDMKAVKMLGLSGVMSDLIQKSRQIEIQTSKLFRKLLIWNVLLCKVLVCCSWAYPRLRLFVAECPQNISPLATFSVYVIIALFWTDASLLTAQAFTAIALINLITTPVLQLVQLMPQLFQCVGSFERIQQYCNYINDASQHGGYRVDSPTWRVPAPSENDRKYVLTLENNSFSWKNSNIPFLKGINLSVPTSSVTVCMGPVGSGKSMLLESILGETVCMFGPAPNRTSSIAYCAQQPWLENGTIRSNIISTSHYDPEWYMTVKSACGLDADLQTLQRGDKTVLGSKGLNLSGGQKQRIVRKPFKNVESWLINISDRPSHVLYIRARI
jgi:ABC-type multidrug transport system fused ATPase/permease subunit